MARGDDEHMNVPTWRMRQLQTIEDAAREVVEMTAHVYPVRRESMRGLLAEVHDKLVEALGDA